MPTKAYYMYAYATLLLAWSHLNAERQPCGCRGGYLALGPPLDSWRELPAVRESDGNDIYCSIGELFGWNVSGEDTPGRRYRVIKRKGLVGLGRLEGRCQTIYLVLASEALPPPLPEALSLQGLALW